MKEKVRKMNVRLGFPIWRIRLPEYLELPNSPVLIPWFFLRFSIEKFLGKILWDCEKKREEEGLENL